VAAGRGTKSTPATANRALIQSGSDRRPPMPRRSVGSLLVTPGEDPGMAPERHRDRKAHWRGSSALLTFPGLARGSMLQRTQMACEIRTEPPGAATEISAEAMTYQQFLHWPGNNHHVEWVNGSMVFMSPVTKPHETIRGFLCGSGNRCRRRLWPCSGSGGWFRRGSGPTPLWSVHSSSVSA
jgi:hypothetical protein